MLKRRSGKKYFGISLPYIPEGYLADIIAYIRKKLVRSILYSYTDQITKPQDRGSLFTNGCLGHDATRCSGN
jgi:hypothetical protein